jgi:hypothetical protein
MLGGRAVPVMKREDWLKLSAREKLMHNIQRTIDRADKLQADYDKGRKSGKISEPIPFMER